MYLRKSDAKPGETFRITIHRLDEKQLDKAIEDLEKRGFQLIKKVFFKSDLTKQVYKVMAILEKIN